MKKIVGFVLIAATAGGLGGFALRERLGRRIPLAPVLETKGPARPMTEWYFADGRHLADSTLVQRQGSDSHAPAREWLVVFNPGDNPAELAVTFFFEAAAPKTVPLNVPPHSSTNLAVHESVASGSRYGTRVRSNQPVVVQSSRGEYFPNNIVTQAMASRTGYPGPLGKRETRWAYADGLVLDNDTPLLEWEWISLVNPAPRPAHVRLRFETAGKVADHRFIVDAERMSTVNLAALPTFPKNLVSGVVIESSEPVVVEQVRRAYQKDRPMVTALWSCFALPIGEVSF